MYGGSACSWTMPLAYENTVQVRLACVFSLLGAMESISSMKMMAGAFFSASSKALRRLLSDSPASLDMISGPLMRKKKAPVSFATALAIKVFPAVAQNSSGQLRGMHLDYFSATQVNDTSELSTMTKT